MEVGNIVKLNNGNAIAEIIKIFSNQSYIIECKDKRLQFVRLVDSNDQQSDLAFSSWSNLFKRY
jgi:hypothetical protein